ncbi:MAG: hypothetical protein AcusKO_14030 [Acuticoccus sp.]
MRTLAHRRALVLVLNGATIALLAIGMALVIGHGGWPPLRVVMMAALLVTLPWLSIGFWNAIIGTVLLARGPRRADPLALEAPEGPITTRTAIVMAVRNEDPERSIVRLRGIFEELDAAGAAAHYDVHVLSDTSDEAIAAREAAYVAHWQATSPHPAQIFYRRRAVNEGFKAGNIREFCERAGEAYTFFLTLDADSYLSAAMVLRLTRLMQAHDEIGILQTLAVGTPSDAFFTRVFQFGMRHGMRAYTAGSAWWAGDCGPYWGHNALIRMAPFRDACRLPVLPGRGPLSGHVMSHDQVEAVLMRRAGYHVRVLVEEGESWEENPPTLPDFIARELRWCQGNMQYFQLLGMPGLAPTSRVQLALAILMYVGAPAWMLFLSACAASLFAGGPGAFAPGLGLVMFATILFMTFAPKILGLVGVLASRRAARRYGGRLRLLAGGLVELLVSTLMAPVVAFSVAVFAFGLLFGRRIDWRAQPRERRSVSWSEALRTFWPQMLFGALLFASLALMLPVALPWAAPVLAGLLLAVPLAVVTASPALGRLSVAAGLCDIPEDPERPAALVRLESMAFA